MGRRSTVDAETQSRVRAALRMGVSQSETARRVGISRDQVRYIAEKAGLVATRSDAHRCADCGRKVARHAA